MLDFIDISNILFFDIETVPITPHFSDLNETWRELWEHKARTLLKKSEEDMTPQDAALVFDRAGIYAEFGRIVCISIGAFYKNSDTGQWNTRLKSFASTDEKALLTEFADLLKKRYNYPDRHFLCGHNIREFDVPYICRRMLIHQMPFPALLNVAGKKPWETKHILDTMELWKFGDGKAYTSLKLLAAVFGFPSPKDDIDGSMVRNVFYEDGDIERIARYCEKDVVAVMQLLLRFKRLPMHLTIDGEIVHE